MTNDADDTRTVSCGMCGDTTTCPVDGIPAGWTTDTDRGRLTYVCVRCAREHLRAIEAKLPGEYW